MFPSGFAKTPTWLGRGAWSCINNISPFCSARSQTIKPCSWKLFSNIFQEGFSHSISSPLSKSASSIWNSFLLSPGFRESWLHLFENVKKSLSIAIQMGFDRLAWEVHFGYLLKWFDRGDHSRASFTTAYWSSTMLPGSSSFSCGSSRRMADSLLCRAAFSVSLRKH